MRAKSRFIFVAVCLGVGFLVTGAAHAGWVASGDLIKVLDTGDRYQDGGPFWVDNVTNTLVPNFISFCMERNEHISFGTRYEAQLSPIAYMGGVGGQVDVDPGSLIVLGDPLDTRTAFLYSNFVHGTLNSLLSGWTTDKLKEVPKNLQEVFWFIEEELPATFTLSKNAQALYDLSAKSNGTLYDVRVMNLTEQGGLRQSLLTTVPEPATVVIWGVFGVCGLLYARRRRKAAK